MGSVLALVVVAALLLLRVEATFYSLPKTWSLVNNESLDVVIESGDSIRLLLSDRESNSFALAFVGISSSSRANSSGPDDHLFVLGIITMPNIDSSLWNVVWCANWDKPVKNNASVGFKRNGNLALWDDRGQEVWSTRVAGGLRVAGLAMEKSGNLLLVDSMNKTRWQSFHSPSDTILPDQWLPVGSFLTSRPTKSNTPSSSYQLKVESSGLGLYAMSSRAGDDQRAPYLIISLSLQQDLEGVLATCFHPVMLGLDYNQGLVIMFDEASTNPAGLINSTICGKPRSQRYNVGKVVLSNSLVSSPQQFVRLDGDGNLQLYEYAVSDRAWKVAASVINSPCDLPGSCNSYGICDDRGGGTCSCGMGTSEESAAAAAFVLIDPNNPSLGCKPSPSPHDPVPEPPAPACLGGGGAPKPTTNNSPDLIQLTNIDYFSNRFVAPNSTTSSDDQCGKLCTSSCSCSASFYHNDTGACYLVETVHTLRSVPRPGYSAQLKRSAARRVSEGDSETPSSNSDDDPSRASAPSPHGNSMPQSRQEGGGRMSLSKSNELAIGLSVGLGGACLFLLFFLYTLYKMVGKRKNVTQVRRLPEEEDDAFVQDDSLPGLPPRYSLKELQMATISFHTKLGSGGGGGGGGFGTVYEGVLADGTKVAVKRLEGIRQNHKEFRAEVATIGSVQHMNLVRLKGFCAEGGHRLLVYEFMPKGSLDKWLFAPKDATNATDAFCLDWNTRFQIALGTARGLAYLHNECSPRIIHMDVKPQNILLDADFFPRVSDFGMSKLMDHEDSGVLKSMRGTPGYLAPELLLRSQVSDKIDIYSYGIVLIELLTGRKSIDMFMEFDSEYFPSWAMNMARDGRLRDALDKRMGDLVPEIQLQRVISIAYWCVHRDFRRRPSMKDVVQMLENLVPVPAIPEAELADLSSFKLPRRLSFNVNNDHPPLKLQRAHSDQSLSSSTKPSAWIVAG